MIKISELPAASALVGTETVAGVQSGVTVKILASAIGTFVRGLFTTTPVAVAEGGTGAATAAAARTALGLAIGSDVQAYDADIPTSAASQAEMEAGTEAALRAMSPLRVAQAIAAGGGKVQDFRLTLTSGLPVTTADVTAASTIYCTPKTGKQISLYTGSAWVTRSSAEFSLALSGLTSGKPYDVFCYDNAGTPTLEFLVWTNDTTRATALAYQDGVLVKSGDATRRYLGTFYTTATTTTEDSVSKRYLWNYYNRVARQLERKETTGSWTYTTATWRQANGATANQVNFVVGVVEDSVSASVDASGYGSAGIVFCTAVGVNSTSAPSGTYSHVSSASEISMTPNWRGVPAVGMNYLAWLEWSRASGTTTFLGAVNTATGQCSSGISAEVKA